MVDTFRALLITKDDDRQRMVVTELKDADLMETMSRGGRALNREL